MVSVNLDAGILTPALPGNFDCVQFYEKPHQKPVIVKTRKTVYNNNMAKCCHQKPRIRNAECTTQALKKNTNFQKLIMTY
jgi:hypothetical protein